MLDDGIKNEQEALSEKIQETMKGFLYSALLTRFHKMEQKTLFCVAETVWSENVSVKMLANSYPAWPYYNLAAIAEPNRIDPLGRQPGELLCEEILSKDELLKLKEISPRTFGALYQGNPINKDATYFNKSNLENSLQLPEIPKAEKPIKVISFDTASETTESADFTVACHWLVYKDFIVVTKIDRMKVDITGLLKYYNTLKADYIICEKASSGLQLLQLKHDCIASLIFKNIVEKEASAKALNALLGNKIFIAPSALTLEIKEEILNFPFGNKDDVALSLMHGFRFINSNAPLKHKVQKRTLNASALMAKASRLEKMRSKLY